MTAYYNEIEPFAAQWLRNLIDRGLIPAGDVDTRSIKEVQPDDIGHYTQVHFFAGIAGWPLALRLAGWPDDRRIWSGSCPCQPFSSAGKQQGHADERHLWPEMFRLARECHPDAVIGEQVASAIGHGWLDGVFYDLEGAGYTCGATVLGAFSVGAPHKRSRLFWVAERMADHQRAGYEVAMLDARGGTAPNTKRETGVFGSSGLHNPLADAEHDGATCGRAHAEPGRRGDPLPDGWRRVMFQAECDPDGDGWCRVRDIDPTECDCIGPTQDGCEYRELGGVLYGRMVNPVLPRLEGHAGHGDDGDQPGRVGAVPAGPVAAAGEYGAVEHPTGDGRDARRAEPDGRCAAGGCGADGMGNTTSSGREESGRRDSTDNRYAGAWSDFTVVHCLDGKARRVGCGVQPLVDGLPRELGRGQPELFRLARRARANRTGRLKGYGNSISPQVAAEFIAAWMEARP